MPIFWLILFITSTRIIYPSSCEPKTNTVIEWNLHYTYWADKLAFNNSDPTSKFLIVFDLLLFARTLQQTLLEIYRLEDNPIEEGELFGDHVNILNDLAWKFEIPLVHCFIESLKQFAAQLSRQCQNSFTNKNMHSLLEFQQEHFFPISHLIEIPQIDLRFMSIRYRPFKPLPSTSMSDQGNYKKIVINSLRNDSLDNFDDLYKHAETDTDAAQLIRTLELKSSSKKNLSKLQMLIQKASMPAKYLVKKHLLTFFSQLTQLKSGFDADGNPLVSPKVIDKMFVFDEANMAHLSETRVTVYAGIIGGIIASIIIVVSIHVVFSNDSRDMMLRSPYSTGDQNDTKENGESELLVESDFDLFKEETRGFASENEN